MTEPDPLEEWKANTFKRHAKYWLVFAVVIVFCHLVLGKFDFTRMIVQSIVCGISFEVGCWLANMVEGDDGR